jgi:class 3 adenylate cyclase
MDASDPPVESQVEAERKLVTVVVCEVGEPAAAGQGDLEDNDRLLADALITVQAEVARHGGLVTEVIGDLVVAVFGVPRTRDDDAERAVLAALAARARLTSPSRGDGRVRAAVASGEALVRVGDSSGGVWGWGVSGEVVAAAMTIKDAAPPGLCWSRRQRCRRPSGRSATRRCGCCGWLVRGSGCRCGMRWRLGREAAVPHRWCLAWSWSAGMVSWRCCWTATSAFGSVAARSW